jgi:endonuclease/exonuclease/phosphatase family metal-dependent hydrolase
MITMNYTVYPPFVVEDIARLRRRIAAGGLPAKNTDHNLLVATWNIRSFGEVHRDWGENPGTPKRNLRALACIAEVIRNMDIVALQEVRQVTSGLRFLLDEFLGPDWGLILSDVTAGEAGNTERLAFVYDKRRVQPSGLAGEIVLPPTPLGDPQVQFARTPYIVGFQAREARFALLTAHINYGQVPADRLPELLALAGYTARELRDRAGAPGAEEKNLIVLGDLNIDKRSDNPLFNAFVSTGLNVPAQLLGLKTTYNESEPKYYDQIGWFMDDSFDLKYNDRAGSVDFAGAIFKEMSKFLMSYRMSDHFPLWVEFNLDRSAEQMGRTLGLDEDHLAMPDPLSIVPD